MYFTRSFGFQSSSMVEHAAVNRVVEGSSPSSGAISDPAAHQPSDPAEARQNPPTVSKSVSRLFDPAQLADYSPLTLH